MKIAWINESASPVGGAERYVRETARALAEHGARSALFYDAGASPDPAPETLAAFEGSFPIVDLARQLRECAPDVVYVHRIGGGAVARALADSPAPVVRFFHDHRLFCLREHKYTAITRSPCTRTTGAGCYPCLGFVRRSERWPGVRVASLRALLAEQAQARRHEAFVVASRYMAEHVAAHGFDRARIHVIPLYARPPPGPRNEEPRDGQLLLFVGQLTTGKGLDVLLQAMARTRAPCRLEVVGHGRQEARLRALARALGLDARVSFLGTLAPEALSAHYRRAACVVSPSRAPETFGLVGIEAMAHGAPVIASAVGGVGEWLDDCRTGLGVPPNDAVALARAIGRLLEAPVLRSELGRNARRAFEAQFLPEHHVTRLRALFESVARRAA